MPPNPTSLISVLILSFHLRLSLPSGLTSPGLYTKTLYTPLLFPIHVTCSTHFIFFYLITQTVLSEQYRSLSSSLRSFLHSPVTPSLLVPNHTYQTETTRTQRQKLLYTRRKLTIQVCCLDVTNTSKFPITAFQASLNTTEYVFVFGVELLLSRKSHNYTPTWYSEYAMNWNIWGSNTEYETNAINVTLFSRS
jgi:hypothetical protein